MRRNILKLQVWGIQKWQKKIRCTALIAFKHEIYFRFCVALVKKWQFDLIIHEALWNWAKISLGTCRTTAFDFLNFFFFTIGRQKVCKKSKGNADEREGPTEKTSILSFDILNTITIFFNFGHCIKKIDGNLTMGQLLCLEECICTTRSQEF